MFAFFYMWPWFGSDMHCRIGAADELSSRDGDPVITPQTSKSMYYFLGEAFSVHVPDIIKSFFCAWFHAGLAR
jgi:hypothetical protein